MAFVHTIIEKLEFIIKLANTINNSTKYKIPRFLLNKMCGESVGRKII